MPSSSTLIYVTFHVAMAVSLLLFGLHLYYPETFLAVQNTANDFMRQTLAQIEKVSVDEIIEATSTIITKIFRAHLGFVSLLLSKGASLIHVLQTLSLPDIMNETKVRVQSLMEWFSALKEVINKASGSTLGRFAIFAAGILVFNNLLALVGTIRTLWGIFIYIVRLACKMVAFIVRLAWNVAAFIVRLF